MVTITKKSNCCGCGVCETVCPKNCIVFCEDDYGFRYPKINEDKCVKCNACEEVCPILNPAQKNVSDNRMFACASRDADSKLQSSSGGIFYLLASFVLSKDGVVFGVALADNCRSSVFKCVKTKEELIPVLGSKYVQARTENVYKIVKQEVLRGVPVLFSGTPCHVAALRNYLKKSYENLYLVDISCHGVPSEKTWNRYLDCREEKNKGRVIYASFRSKESGWENFSIATDFDNGSHHSMIFTEDSYGKAFTKRLLFRPSCEHCKFKGLNRWSDITLADFWGISEVTDRFNDDQGTSLFIVHSDKGETLMQSIDDSASVINVTQEQGTRRNPYLFRSVIPHSNKKAFFEAVDKEDFDNLVEKYATDEFIFRDFLFDLKRYIKRKVFRK